MRCAKRFALVLAALLVVGMAVAAGASATSNGIMSWGENYSGGLGTGGDKSHDAPVTLKEPIGVTAIAAGSEFSLAVVQEGKVEGWGEDRYGELGNGETKVEVLKPVEVRKLSKVINVAGGYWHSLALLENGTVWAWGANGDGQLGVDTTEDHDEPVEISGLKEVVAIAARGNASYALLKSGRVMAWGENKDGQLGDGTTTGPEECSGVPCSKKPVEVHSLETVKAIAAGVGFGLALLESGTVKSWGSNLYGELGDGTTEDSDEPVTVEGLAGVTAVAAGWGFGLAVLEGGTAKAWGLNFGGELGDGSVEGPEKCGVNPCSVKPVAVSGLSKVTSIAAGEEYALAVLENGSIKAWGSNYEGALGIGKFTGPEECALVIPCSRTPVAVSEITGKVAGVAAGEQFSLAFGPPGPIVTKVEPSTGSPEGGTKVTITGLNFSEVTAVKFGSIKAKSYTVESETKIVAESPAGSGRVPIAVTTSSGTIPTSQQRLKFRYTTEEAPEFGRCVKVAEGMGEYSDAGCTAKTSGGSYKWKPGAEKQGFSLTGGASTLETVGKAKMTCTGMSGSGKYLSPKEVGSVSIKLTGCEHATAKCTTAGAAEGEVITSTLTGELGWRKISTGKVGLDLAPVGEGSVAEATCGSAHVRIEGSVIANTAINKMLKEATLGYEQSGGDQKPDHFEGEEADILETSFGEKLEKSGLALTVTQVNEEAIEINTGV
jgi:alpha-tubulin suppressor-like RCC1 family protein